MIEIVPLGPEEKGRELTFHYRTNYYYDVTVQEGPEGWRAALERRPFGQTEERESKDKLLEDWLEEPQLYGAVEDGQTMGYLELSHERWNNRMRISNILVADGARRRGIGSLLMETAVSAARQAGARALVLETQSCNDPAIQFYRKNGFSLTGFDLTAYSQTDVEKREVRLELARALSP